MINYKTNFDDFMLSINTENGLGIWWALGLRNEKTMTTREKFLKLKEFFEYAIVHNRIIEYDLEKKRPIFPAMIQMLFSIGFSQIFRWINCRNMMVITIIDSLLTWR